MNKVYKVIWSKVRGCYVVVSELAKNHSKVSEKRANVHRGGMRAAALSAAILASLTLGIALPQSAEASMLTTDEELFKQVTADPDGTNDVKEDTLSNIKAGDGISITKDAKDNSRTINVKHILGTTESSQDTTRDGKDAESHFNATNHGYVIASVYSQVDEKDGTKLGSTGQGAVTVAGIDPQAAGKGAAVVGGVNGHASGVGAVVSGGSGNTASGDYSTVSGGVTNTASGRYSTVSGGNTNTAQGENASVSGGKGNTASGGNSSVTGGQDNKAEGVQSAISGGRGNTTSGDSSSISGGYLNIASGYGATVNGGAENVASGNYASLNGGRNNAANGSYASVSGGRYNLAAGFAATVNGGNNNVATGNYSYAAGGPGGSVQGSLSTGIGGGSTGANANYATAVGDKSLTTTESGLALGFEATTDEYGTIAFGHDKGDAAPDKVEWQQRTDNKQNPDGTTNDYTKAPTITSQSYDSAGYNRLVKAGYGQDGHDVATMDQRTQVESGSDVVVSEITDTKQDETGANRKAKIYQVDLKDTIELGKTAKGSNPAVDGHVILHGAPGHDNIATKADIYVGPGKPDVDDNPETTTITRVRYKDEDNIERQVATLDDGMKYTGDDGGQLQKKINDNVNIKGGSTDVTGENNVGVISNGTDTLNIRLAKNLKGLSSAEFSGTDSTGAPTTTTINSDGVTISNGPSVTRTNVNMGGNKVTGVADGEADNDAATVGQLNKTVNAAKTKYYGAKATADLQSAAQEYVQYRQNLNYDAIDASVRDQVRNGTFTNENGEGAMAENTLAAGVGAVAAGVGDTAIGALSVAQGGTAIGMGSVAVSDTGTGAADSIAIGRQAVAGSGGKQANGDEVKKGSGIAIGTQSNAAAYNVSIGMSAGSGGTGAQAVNIGRMAGTGSTAADTVNIGYQSGQFNGGRSGYNQGAHNVNIGSQAGWGAMTTNTNTSDKTGQVAGENVSVGVKAGFGRVGDNTVSVGNNSSRYASGSNNVTVGSNAGSNVKGSDNVFIGRNANNLMSNSWGLHTSPEGVSSNSVVIGSNTKIQGDNNISIGNNNVYGGSTKDAQAKNTVAIGSNIKNVKDGSVALGSESAADEVVGTSSATVGDTTINNFAGTNPTGTVGIGSAGKERTITHVAAGRISADSTDAINGSQLYQVADKLDATHTSVKAGENKNLTVTSATRTDGGTEYTVDLSDELNIGTPGKDGRDGKIGVNGKDGQSGVGIDGKDGISIKGADGKDGVTINGKDGKDGTEGHIGLTGPKGKDGIPTHADIHVGPGQPGVDGADGTTMTRVLYEDEDGAKHEVATLDDGMKYTGDNGLDKQLKRHLNTNVNIQGGTTDISTGNNIGVISDGTDTLTLRLAKNLKSLASAEFDGTDASGATKTTINSDGVKVTNGPSLTKSGIDAGNKKITNVAAGTADTDAVNVSQLNEAMMSSAKPTTIKAGDDNLTVTEKHAEGEGLNYTLGLSDNVTVGKSGEADRTGTVTVNSETGENVVIDGKKGISVNGHDGQDGVTITGPNGKDGLDGLDGKVVITADDGADAVSISGQDGTGHIGLTGPAGTNGKDNTYAVDITVRNGKNGENGVKGAAGVDGNDGITRIHYEDKNGEHQVATMDDGMKYAGDINPGDAPVGVKLNNTAKVVGGETVESNLTSGNIGVVASKDGDDAKLEVKLAKDLKNLSSAEFTTAGNTTTISGSGLTISNGPAVTATNVTMAGQVIHNVSTGTADSDAANIKYVKDHEDYVESASIDYTKQAVVLKRKLGDTVEVGFAGLMQQLGSDFQLIKNPETKTGDYAVDANGNLTLVVKDLKAADPAKTRKNIIITGLLTEANVNNKGVLKFGANTGTAYKAKLGDLITVKGTDPKADHTYTEKNITTEVDENGNILIKMDSDIDADKITVGKDGKDGVDGHIGIKGKDGQNGVGIDGKDGISVKGKDGENGVTIRGEDGKDGTNGHIGLRGPKGEDQKNTNADIHVIPGNPGVDGAEGSTMTRVVYKDEDDVEHQIATFDDGMKFSGDSGKQLKMHLNENVNVKGGVTDATKLAEGNNVGVVADGDNDTLNIRLAKNLTGLNSADFGNTTISNTGLTIGGGGDGSDIVLTQNNISMGSHVVHNVASGTEDSDAANRGDIKDIAKANDDYVISGTVTGGANVQFTRQSGDTFNVNLEDIIKNAGAGKSTTDYRLIPNPAEGTDGKYTVNDKGEVTLTLRDMTKSNPAEGEKKVTLTGILSQAGFEKNGSLTFKANSGVAATPKKDSYKVTFGDTVSIKGADKTEGHTYKPDNLTTEIDQEGNITVMMDSVIDVDGINVGRDGENGTEGHIRLTGPVDSSTKLNGIDGSNSVDITVKQGSDDNQNGILGGSDIKGNQMNRIFYQDGKGDHQIATMEDGMQYSGDRGTPLQKTLGSNVDIKGGALAGANLSDGNIGVDADGDSTLNIKLNKALTGLTSAEFGNTTIDNDGLKIKVDGGSQDIKLTGTNITMGGHVVNNLGSGMGTVTKVKDLTNDQKRNAATIGDVVNIDDYVKSAKISDDYKSVILTRKNGGTVELDFSNVMAALGSDYRLIANPAKGADNKYTVDEGGNLNLQVVNSKDPSQKPEIVTITGLLSKDNVKKTGVLKFGANTGIDYTAQLGDTITVKGADKQDGHTYTTKNLTTEIDEKGNIKILMDSAITADKIKVGKDGKDGVSITGPQGENGVNGKIGISGADGKDAISISGKNGEGHIGLAGKNGTNGKDGNSIDISVKNGYNGTDGTKGAAGVDGNDGITRIVYEDKNGEHQVATLHDGMKYAGDINPTSGPVGVKLNNIAKVTGGVTQSDSLTSDNIGVVASKDGDNDAKLEVKLAKDLKGLNSAVFDGAEKGSYTTVNGEGLQIQNGASITKTKGVDAGGKKITNVQAGINKNDAVNVEQLNTKFNDVNIEAGKHTTVKAGDNNLTVVKSDKIDDKSGAEYVVDLSDNLTLGKAETPAGAGVEGHISVNGGTKQSAVDIDGNGGISVKGKKGDAGVTIQGVDVAEGTEGHIMLQGHGGHDDKITHADIYTKPGNPVLGGDTKNASMTRVAYKDEDDKEHEIATFDDGMLYSGDSGEQLKKKLNSNVNIKGGAEATAVAENANIGVISDGTDTLKLKLAKNLKGLTSAEFGDTTINAEGVTITDGPTLTKTSVSAGNNQITSVASGLGNTKLTEATGATLNNAVNVGDLKNAYDHAADIAENGDYYLRNGDTDLGSSKTGYKVDENGNVTMHVKNDKQGNKDVIIGDVASKAKQDEIINNVTNLTESDKGSVKYDLNDDNKTYNKNSVTLGGNDYSHSVAKDGTITSTGGTRITNVAYSNGTGSDAVNVDYLNDKLGAVDAKVGKHTTVEIAKDEKNLSLQKEINEVGGKKYILDLSDDINIGKAGKDGKDGVDGKIGVNGADGVSGVGIDGKDGITVKGKDGKSGKNGEVGINGKDGISIKGDKGDAGVTIKGIDGTNGTEGHIGLQGPAGHDGRNTNADIYVIPGHPGVEGDEENESMTRVAYKDEDSYEHQIATFDDGMKFSGDSGSQLKMHINENVNIKGGATKVADNDNIGVISDKDTDTLMLRLAKDLTGLSSATFTTNAGDSTTVINGDGVIIKIPVTGEDGKLTTKAGPSITNDGISGGGRQITNVASGLGKKKLSEVTDAQKTNAANIGDLQKAYTEATKAAANSDYYLHNGTETVKAAAEGQAEVKGYKVADDGTVTMQVKNADGQSKDNVVIGNVASKTQQDINTQNITKNTENIKALQDGAVMYDTKTENGKTVVDKSKITLGGDTYQRTDKDGKVINNGGTKITNVAYSDGTGSDAVNVDYLKDQIKTATDTIEGHHTTVKAGKNQNLTVEEGKNNTGGKEYTIDLSDELNIGTPGKDGKDGHIGVNGKDGKSGVGIDGKDGISIKGEDGKDAVGLNGKDGLTIYGKDGKNGESAVSINGKDGVGHIGLTGPAGTNGKDGKNAVDISVKNGYNGKDGTNGEGTKGETGVDGKNGITRIVYEDKTGEHQVATLEDGMKYKGDSGDELAVKLNNTVNIKGGATEFAEGNNIGVVGDANKNTLTVKLAKDVTGLNSVTSNTFIAGDKDGDHTTINKDGVTINNGPSITKNGIDANKTVITNVLTDAKNPSSAANVAYVNSLASQNAAAINQNRVNINKLGNRINRVGAGAAALAALHPLDFDPDAKWDFAAGYGNFRGASAAAVGAYYRPNENTMFSVGGSFGGGENMVNAGVSFKLGTGANHVTTSRVAMAKELKNVNERVAQLEASNAKLAASNAKLTAVLNAFLGLDMPIDKTTVFPDVPANHWAYEAVQRLASQGLVHGYPDGTFGGNRALTRYEFATIVNNALKAGAAVEQKLIQEFKPELQYIRIDAITHDKDGNPAIERVRVVK